MPAVPEVRITDVDIFRVEVPVEPEHQRLGVRNWFTVGVVDTDAGVRGYSFADPSVELLSSGTVQRLVGSDLFALDTHVRETENRLRGFEHAIWDAIGKVTGQPAHRVMAGHGFATIPAYLTCVWGGSPDQSDVDIEEQAAFACLVRDAGYRAMKIRAWRPDPLDDVRACGAIRAAVGPDFELMVDRTADSSGTVWEFDTALRVARGLEEHAVSWLEEPFARGDLESPRRLRELVDIPITGGESFRTLQEFRDALAQESFDVLQPDAMVVGGLHMLRKVATLCEAADVPCIPHGYGSLPLAGYLQVAAAVGVAWQEIVYVVPPDLPGDLWWPATALLAGDQLYSIVDGEVEVPTGVGLGLDVDEDALARHRVETFSVSTRLVPLGDGQIRRLSGPTYGQE